MADSQLAYQHQKRTMVLFCICYALAVIPLIGVIDSAIVVISLLCIFYRYGEIINKFRGHPKYIEKLIISLVVALITGFLFAYGVRVHLVNAFIDLLISGIALKFLEQGKQRDLSVHVMSLLFLSAIPFIFHFSWYMLGYLLIVVFFNFAAMMSLYAYQNIRHIFRYTLKAVMLAIPLCCVVFIILPRFNPFWQMPSNEVKSTGLGEEIDFNSVSELIQDHSVAFRVKFDGEIPKERYFTATFYPQFDPIRQGFLISGEMARYEYKLQIFSTQNKRDRISYNFGFGNVYHLYMEPSQRKWIPTLDPSVSENDQIFYTPYRTWVDRVAITLPRYYKFKYLDSLNDQEYLLRAGKHTGNNRYLLQTGFYRANPKTRQLIEKWKKETSSDRELALKILNYFRIENFRYTLSPVTSNPNSPDIIDEFLFNNRNGFCNHYSSAAAYMLRLAGIPAMVAGGYLGGSINSDDNFVTVRNSDAHSWVVAIIDNHWTRIDPVTAIAPERIERSYFDLQNPDTLPITSFERYRNTTVISWLREKLDALEFKWNSLILNYNFSEEKGFLAGFMMEHTVAAVIMLMISLVTVVYLTLLISKLLRKSNNSPVADEYFRYIKSLEAFNLPRSRHETPDGYLYRILPKIKSSELRKVMTEITVLLNDILYSGKTDRKFGLKQLKSLRSEFNNAVKSETKLRGSRILHM
jgi:transglutaminase-like putative cysteine protease